MSTYIKPNIDTKFHIDFYWWEKTGKNLRSYIQSLFNPESEMYHAGYDVTETFDWIDPETGEISKIPMLWLHLREEAQGNDEFIDEYTSLTTGIFRAFVVNNNVPLTPTELYQQLQKQSPNMILQTIGRYRTHDGIRPSPFQG